MPDRSSRRGLSPTTRSPRSISVRAPGRIQFGDEHRRHERVPALLECLDVWRAAAEIADEHFRYREALGAAGAGVSPRQLGHQQRHPWSQARVGISMSCRAIAPQSRDLHARAMRSGRWSGLMLDTVRRRRDRCAADRPGREGRQERRARRGAADLRGTLSGLLDHRHEADGDGPFFGDAFSGLRHDDDFLK